MDAAKNWYIFKIDTMCAICGWQLQSPLREESMMHKSNLNFIEVAMSWKISSNLNSFLNY